MRVFKEIQPLRAYLKQIQASAKSIGFVPTMGALHSGHLSLIQASKKDNPITVSSIYLNPAQFNNPEDLAKYPRTLAEDLAMLENEGCEVVFAPSNEEMYATTPTLRFDFGGLDQILEGQYRPGHFSGVALVVAKLFNIVQPQVAYFGQKDFQQVKIIERLVEELKFDLHLRCMPIVREPDGLAMSSRNKRLNAEERKQAPLIYQSLVQTQQRLQQGQSMSQIRSDIAHQMAQAGIRLEYLELVETQNLSRLNHVVPKSILLVAAYLGEVRLIDNLMLE